MEKLKILFFCLPKYSFNQYSVEYFKQALSQLRGVDVRFCSQAGDIRDILARLDFNPDFIYIHNLEQFQLKVGPITGFHRINIPRGFLFNDLHRNAYMMHDFVKKNQAELIFTHYRDTFLRYFPQYKDRMRWLPHHANLSIYYDFQKLKTTNYLLLGCTVPKYYPLRHLIYKSMRKKPGFEYHPHPGYIDLSPEQKQSLPIGSRFAKYINRAKIFFTDDLVFKYPINKYFEVPACNTLLLATGSQELRDLGFIDGVTFVEITKNNFLEKAEYYLSHRAERSEIAKRGYEMVRSNHSTRIRAKQFVMMIQRYLEGRSD